MPKFNPADTNLNDYMDSISRGDIVGVGVRLIEGVNRDIDTASEEDLWFEGGSLSYLSSAETMSVVSTSINDDTGGTGATTLFIQGLDASFSVVTEIITLDGQTPVITSNSFYRILFAFTLSAGSGLTNAGDITLTATSASTVQASVEAGFSSTTLGFGTIPAGKSAIIKQIEMDSSKLAGGQEPLVNFKVFARFPGANQPWVVILERRLNTGVHDQLIIPFPVSPILLAGADVRFSASTNTNNTEARLRMTLLEYDV